MTFHSAARADACALGVGLAIGSAVGLVLGGAYFAGGMARASDAKAQARTAAHVALLPASVLTQASVPTAQTVTRASAALRPAESVRVDPGRELDCLADAVYYEARGETPAGQAAIAQVVMNRVRHPAFPKSICGVVFQGAAGDDCQFSFACNGAMRGPKDRQAWARAEQIAARALAGAVMPQIGQATHFHAASVRPDWGPSLMRVAQVGLHVFYRFGHAAPAADEDAPIQTAAVQPEKPRAVYASMIPGFGADAHSAQAPGPAAPAQPAAAAVPAVAAASPPARPKADADAAPKPTEVASAS